MDDGPSDQLLADLQDCSTRSYAERRPIVHHLNADSSWLVQIPRPLVSVQRGGRHWFNILVDPWLSGTQSDIAPWFSTQKHVSAPAVASIAAVESLAQESETLTARGFDPSILPPSSRRSFTSKGHHTEDSNHDRTSTAHTPTSLIDCIGISHEFTDHCHRETLLQCRRDVPVLAPPKAAKLIESWDHFFCVLETPTFPEHSKSRDWRSTSIPPLPEWLGISRILSLSQPDNLYYHSAIMITFAAPTLHPSKPPPNRTSSSSLNMYFHEDDHSLQENDNAPAEAIIYTPHGVHAEDLRVVAYSSPPISTLAFFHGLHDVAIPKQQLNLGGHNGLKALRLLKPRYWIGTHDAKNVGSGVVSWFLKRKVVSLEEALDEEMKHSPKRQHSRNGDVRDSGGNDETTDPRDELSFFDVANGESLVLR